MELVGPVIEVVKCICAPLARRINYLINFHDNMNKLKTKKNELIAEESDIKMALERAKEQRKKPTDQVLLWLNRVDSVKNQVGNIERQLEENQRCFRNCCSRIKLGKLVFEVTQEVLELLEANKFPNGFLMDQPPDKALVLPTSSLVGRSAAEKTLGEIWDSLMDPLNRKIGIYGMGGVGKTTIIKHIQNRLAETSHFDKIIWVTISKDLNLKRLQDDIAQQLNLDLSQCRSEEIRVARLQERLNQANKFLLILDDAWERISLNMVGIPEPSSKNNCKIVLTTRSLQVCRGMETQHNIKVKVLFEEEAWDLFVTKAGNQVLIPEIQPVAKDIVKECCGLPLAIITVGRAMREVDDIKVWRNALNELRNSTTEIQGMEDEVFKHLKFSYTHLRSDTLRNCFLYCSLFPEDYQISCNELIEYWMAEGLIPDVGDRVAEIDKGFVILKELKDVNMLEDGRGASIVMHDLIRDLAIAIGRQEFSFLVKAGLGLEEPPKEEEWAEARKISLMRNKIEALLEKQPHCPNLSTLLLPMNPLSQNIPCSLLFNQMLSLQVLDLSHSRISQLPSSLSNLTNLRALFLKNCRCLETLPSLANLKELRALNLSCTSIKELPKGMEGLVNLRFLDLSRMSEMKNIQAGLIQKLSLLEDLRVHKSPFFLGELDTCIKEIDYLKRLTNLTLSVGCLVNFNKVVKCIQWERLKGFFQIYIGNPIGGYVTSNNGVCISTVDMSVESALLLPTNTQYLNIIDCSIPQLSKFRNLRLLKDCQLLSCHSMDCLVEGDELEDNALTNLEELEISTIKNLKVLWKGLVPHGSLINLRILNIDNCADLKNLFAFKLLQNLKNIEHIQVNDCQLMEEIVTPDGEGCEEDPTTATVALPRLRVLELRNLPKLHTIISGKMLVCDSLVYKVEGCPKLKKLPFRADGLSNLPEINGEIEWWEAVEWDDAHTKTLLQPRFTTW